MPLRPVYPVRSDRLLLRPLHAGDAAGLLDYRSQPEVCRWVPFEPMSAAEIETKIRGSYTRTTLETGGEGLTLGVELTSTEELVGDVMLHWVSAEHCCGEVGYMFQPTRSEDRGRA